MKIGLLGFLVLMTISFACSSKGTDSAGAAGASGGSDGTGTAGGTPDTTAPSAGTAITFSSIGATSLSISWGAASDSVTAAASLEYRLVRDSAATANIDTIAEVDAKSGGDLVQDYTANLTSRSVTGLTGATTYHFAVVVRDAAGNKTIYAPATQATNVATAPTVTNVVVASTNPNNGVIPFNTGTTTLTITGTEFLGTTCPAGVSLDDAAVTVASSCTVDSNTQITATFPAGIRTNGTTGWNVRVTNLIGTNATSAVKFIPKAGLLISEVLLGTTTSASNEYVEIYNATDNSINLSTLETNNFRVRRRTAGGGDNAMTLTYTNSTVISHGFFLACSAVSTAETWWSKCDATFTAGIAASNMISIGLGTGIGKAFDLVGWGTITEAAPGGCEGGNANCTNLATINNSIERKPAGGAGHATDTDNNLSDFNGQSTTLTPRGTVDAAQP